MKMSADLILVDLETNGAKKLHEIKITEIGAVRLEASTLKELDHFKSYVDGRPLCPISIEVTGITEEFLNGFKTFQVIGDVFRNWVYRSGDANFIMSAWGIYYDVPVLRKEYESNYMKYPFPGKGFCVKTAMFYFAWTRGCSIKNCGVQTALKLLDLEFQGKPHDALDDVRNEARILRVITGIERGGPKAQLKFGRFVGEYGKPISEPDIEEKD